MRVSGRYVRAAVLAGLAVTGAAGPVFAQTSFKLGDKEVQVHGSVQQGFLVNRGNNFLTLDAQDGSGALTDGALNLSSSLTRKLRVGGQIYARNIGDIGNGRLQLDWAFADYRFAEAIGVRAGKVKTPLGLFNDTQDMEFLHTWALLPQSVYPLDLRSITIAHVGADVYGTVGLGRAGSLQYSAYAGGIEDDKHGGYRYAVEDRGLTFTKPIDALGRGFDLRWSTPVDGLMTGYSFLHSNIETQFSIPGAAFRLPIPALQLDANARNMDQQALFADYQKERLRLSSEYRRYYTKIELTPAVMPTVATTGSAWFAAGSYRVAGWLELGSYLSRYVANNDLPSSEDTNHIYDTAISARFDVTSFWNVKVEGHFMDGYGDVISARGFYLRSNPLGFEPQTRMLIVRTGFSF